MGWKEYTLREQCEWKTGRTLDWIEGEYLGRSQELKINSDVIGLEDLTANYIVDCNGKVEKVLRWEGRWVHFLKILYTVGSLEIQQTAIGYWQWYLTFQPIICTVSNFSTPKNVRLFLEVVN